MPVVAGDVKVALLSLVQFAEPNAAPRLERLVEQAAEALRPEPPPTLETPDGHVVTGLVVLDRGRAILFVGIRQAPTSSASSPARRSPEPRHEERPFQEREHQYDDQVLWRRPYGR